MRFRRFIAVDWSGAKTRGSGAKTRGHKGVAVAECTPGRCAPRLVDNPRHRLWRRNDALDWLSERIATNGPVLIGLDFAFALPWDAGGGYFPGSGVMQEDAAALWRLVEEVCGNDADLYASSFVARPQFACFFRSPGKCGSNYQPRLRKTEERCVSSNHGTPESVFKLIGPKQVGLGSLAGMRLLHQLKACHGDAIKVWPFDPVADGDSDCVEIFPRLFIPPEMGARKIRGLPELNKALAYYESDPRPKAKEKLSDHDTDALVSAAALRHLAGCEKLWCPKGMTPDVARREGWIFGVE